MLKTIGFLTLLTATLVPALCQSGTPVEIPTLVPTYKYAQTLVAATQLSDKRYLAFPALLRIDEDRLLVAYKRGYSHARDPEADFEILHINPVTQYVDPDVIDLHKPRMAFENGEFARFSNGDIALYLDVEAPYVSGAAMGIRTGLHEYRSTDGGRSFHDAGKVGVIDGVEYGYAFEAVTAGNETNMLVMTFTNLQGGEKNASPSDPPPAGSVDVIRTYDNGKTWHFVRSLSREFGEIPINESSLTPYQNGFLTATRGYGNHQWIQRVDGDFKLQKQVDLTASYSFVTTQMGRPRIFEHDGGYYLLARNWPRPGLMRLSLFRLDPQTLAITKHVILDNAESESVADGYYAVPYWQERNGHSFFNVITYKRMETRDNKKTPIQIKNDVARTAMMTATDFSRFPDIVRLEFDWDEVR